MLSITGGGRPMAVGVARLPLIFLTSTSHSSGHPLPFAKPLTSTCLDPALVFGWGRHQIGKGHPGAPVEFCCYERLFSCVISLLFGLFVFLYNICHFERGAGICFLSCIAYTDGSRKEWATKWRKGNWLGWITSHIGRTLGNGKYQYKLLSLMAI